MTGGGRIAVDGNPWNGLNEARSIPGGGRSPSMLEVPDTQLGRTVPVFRDQGIVSLINAQGHSEHGMVATVHAQVSAPDYEGIAANDRRVPIVGILQWGQGGARFEAKIDLRTGVCASFVATSMSLGAIYEDDGVGAPTKRASKAVVSAAIVWGTRPGRSRATRTLPAVTIPIGGSQTFEIPPFAYSLAFYTTLTAFYNAAATNLITLHGGPTITDDPQLAVTSGQLLTSPLTFDGVLLPGNARFVTLQNTSGVALPVRPCFALEL